MKVLVPVVDKNGHATSRWKNSTEAPQRLSKLSAAEITRESDTALHARISPGSASLSALRSLFKDFRDPAGATNFCEYASEELRSEIGGEIVRLTGLRDEPSRNPNDATSDGIEHHVVLNNGYIYDFTARQFEPDSPFPVILPAEEFLAFWNSAEIFSDEEQDWIAVD